MINVNVTDDSCFALPIMAALYSTDKNGKNPCQVSSYQDPPYQKRLYFEGIRFLVALKDMPKFEKLNNILVNVLVGN